MAAPCDQCIKGSIHSGLPIGKEELIHGLNTYVVGDTENPKKIIVMYSDIFGLLLPNNKLIADAIAKDTGYLVYLPDFFEGDAVPLSVADALIPVDANAKGFFAKYTGMLATMPTFIMWSTRHKHAAVDKICMDFLTSLRKATFAQGTKVGMVGFCWGGRYTIRAARAENSIAITEGGEKHPLIDAAVALHPSNLVLPADAVGITVPVSYGWGAEDSFVSIATKGKIEEIPQESKVESEHKVYTPGRHGFAVRGNPDDPAERKCLEDSIVQIKGWFGKYL